MIKRGRYRHFKGKEYEVLDFATHSELWNSWSSIARFMGKESSGFVLLPCGRKW